MSYKVTYYKLGISVGGSIGNISQGGGHIFTDCKIEDIPAELNKYLATIGKFGYVGVITSIEDVGGVCIPTVAKEETVQETPPSAGGNPTKDQYWECWKKAVGTEVGGADYLRFLSWYKTLNSDNHGN